jgi:hypothetical protein
MFRKQACISGMDGPESVFCATVVIIVGTPKQLGSLRQHLHIVKGHQAIVRLYTLIHRRLIIGGTIA